MLHPASTSRVLGCPQARLAVQRRQVNFKLEFAVAVFFCSELNFAVLLWGDEGLSANPLQPCLGVSCAAGLSHTWEKLAVGGGACPWVLLPAVSPAAMKPTGYSLSSFSLIFAFKVGC